MIEDPDINYFLLFEYTMPLPEDTRTHRQKVVDRIKWQTYGRYAFWWKYERWDRLRAYREWWRERP